MTWRTVHAAVAGTSHVENGASCQDDHLVATYSGPEEVLVALIADGAGSAARAEQGASIACETVNEVLKYWVNERTACDLTSEIVIRFLEDARLRIRETAESENLTARDFACTLLLAIVGTKTGVFAQIGDGGIVIGNADGYSPVFWPDAGEYANMTYFVTDDDALEHLQFAILPAPDEVAMFSDGLQRLALDYRQRQAYSPFFSPMFERVRKSDIVACESLCEQLGSFLNSQKVNERTDDDKTLILATRRA